VWRERNGVAGQRYRRNGKLEIGKTEMILKYRFHNQELCQGELGYRFHHLN